ncbi:MAG: arginase [Acidobacteria bacterium]|nr:arginase [Acidobacteriota bacterium]
MTHSDIAIIGAPLDLGAGRRGVDMGPSALRVASLHPRLRALGCRVRDLGNIAVDQPESVAAGHERARYLDEIVRASRRLAGMVAKAAGEGATPLVLGGDHSVAVGTVSGMARHLRRRKASLGLIWMDAHADMNTPESSPSGNVHGMPLACIVGLGPRELSRIDGYAPKVDPRKVALVGIRDVDQLEKPQVKESGVRAFTMRDIDERGMRAILREALEVACDGTAGFHLSLDMDALDPREAPGVGTPVRGGLRYREAHLAMELICDSGRLLSLEVVEVNPVMDVANRTAELAVGLALSAMGKRIL